jgi:hypothetical protein
MGGVGVLAVVGVVIAFVLGLSPTPAAKSAAGVSVHTTTTGAEVITPPASMSPSAPVFPLSSAAPTPSAKVPTTPTHTKSSSSPPSGQASTSRPSPAPAGYRDFTFVNAESQTIWLASNPSKDHPLADTGWVLAPGQTTTVRVPDGWGGRFWGRTGCSFSASGQGHCATGDCDGQFQCRGDEGGPTTLGEFTLNSFDGLDFYDVSMVDGANVPMYINISHTTSKDPVSANGCSSGGCTKPVACPIAMTVGSGACESPCAAFGNDMYCCRGAWAGRADCIPSKWTVDYTLVFKKAEPYAYSYSYDDSATMACKGECDYRITLGVTPGG